MTKSNQQISLTNLDCGKTAIINQIIPGIHGDALTTRFQSLGLVSGKKVKVIRKSWLGGTLHVKVGNTTAIALRPQEADLILVNTSMDSDRISIPQSWLIILGKWVWQTLWHIMMSQLAPTAKTGEYQRPSSQFRHQVKSEVNCLYPPEIARYRLYVGISCPWAHRTLMVRALKGLEDAIEVEILIPDTNSGGWVMEKESENCKTLAQLYRLSQADYQGRNTVPVLWDKQTKTIVNNESADIILMLNSEFNDYAHNPSLNLYPWELVSQIEQWNEKIYQNVNNGVYRCGFAQTQEAYEVACRRLFATLEEIETHLSQNRYLCGDSLTLADVRLFTTLIRFDMVYFSLFKCSLRAMTSYENLTRYIEDINSLPNIKNTYDLPTIKQDYYGNLFPLNPSGIIPLTK